MKREAELERRFGRALRNVHKGPESIAAAFASGHLCTRLCFIGLHDCREAQLTNENGAAMSGAARQSG
ncbi:hypothetical protein [Paraburkholderia sp.]|uniref:hypothetical protein n=1 Tax=Paraburkholderia sp. TaxID=1926495 RepID=UPI00286F1AA9|nr:hypothetical protein [Paraburkholderia sp.]